MPIFMGGEGIVRGSLWPSSFLLTNPPPYTQEDVTFVSLRKLQIERLS